MKEIMPLLLVVGFCLLCVLFPMFVIFVGGKYPAASATIIILVLLFGLTR